MGAVPLSQSRHDAPQSTHQKLIDAARTVFARDGLLGATTREIARVAGVNEVTLFRRFTSKDNLLLAVLRDGMETQRSILAGVQFDMADVREDLTRFAGMYFRACRDHEIFIRAFIAEAHRLPDPVRKAVSRMPRPLGEALRAYLTEAQRRCLLREVPVQPAIDAFTSMLSTAVLKRAFAEPQYSLDTYIQVCVDIFLNGIKQPL